MAISLTGLTITLLAMANPIGNSVIFLSMMDKYNTRQKRLAIIKSTCIFWLSMILSGLGGAHLLQLFGVSIQSFAAAGGLVLINIGMTMMCGDAHASHHNTKHNDQNSEDDPVVVPLTIPMLVGPGTLVTVITFIATNGITIQTVSDIVISVSAVSVIIASVYYLLTLLPTLKAKTIYVINRIMGLIITAMGMQMIMMAIKQFFV